MLFPTTLVGSYPQPEWLIDRAKLAGRFPPRVRARELWRVADPLLTHTLFPVYVAVLLWVGLLLRESRLRDLIGLPHLAS